MAAAVDAAVAGRLTTAPNPWVGAAIRSADGTVVTGYTQPPGEAHAEVMVIRAARDARIDLTGATLATTLEPCTHTGRTGPCTEAILAAGISRVLVGVIDPDPLVAGSGVEPDGE